MTAAEFVGRLDGVRPRGSGRWSARCPAHEDRGPSLSIREAADRILLHCFAECKTREVVAALGLELKDLFTDNSPRRGRRLAPKPPRPNLRAIAFQFETAALDRRLRAEAVLRGVAEFDGDLSDSDRDRLMDAIARAFEDQDRAEFLESTADDLRFKTFTEG